MSLPEIKEPRKRVKEAQEAPVSMIDDPECISMRESLEADQSSIKDISTENLPKLLSHLREYEIQCASCEKYQQAKLAKSLSNLVRTEMQKSRPGKASPHTAHESSERDRRHEFEEKYKIQLQDYDKETELKMEYVKKRQSQKLERFNQKWTEEMPRKYRKPSQRLLQLKQIERTLAMAGEYDRASEIHSQADTLTEKEMQHAQTLLLHDYKSAKDKLVQKQATEIESLVATRREGRRLIEAKREVELAAAMNRNIVMQQRRRELSRNTKFRCTTACAAGSSISALQKEKFSTKETLLPPLLPPTDKKFDRMEEEKKREQAKAKRELEKKKEEERKRKHQLILEMYAVKKPTEKPTKTVNPTFVTEDETMTLARKDVENEMDLSSDSETLEEEETKEQRSPAPVKISLVDEVQSFEVIPQEAPVLELREEPAQEEGSYTNHADDEIVSEVVEEE